MVSAAFVAGLPVSTRAVPLTRSSLCGARLSAAPVMSCMTIRMVENASPSVPFLPKPKNLSKDMIGYAGFDPLNITVLFDVKWMQESEIKHGRICMLAFVGMLVQEFVHLPDPQFSNPLATEAFKQVPTAGLWQIFLFCGLAEMLLHRGRISYLDMFENGAEPGKLGFNPMGLKYDDKTRLKEIKNGRLAMCGVGGVIHSMFIYKQPIVDQLLHFRPMSVNL